MKKSISRLAVVPVLLLGLSLMSGCGGGGGTAAVSGGGTVAALELPSKVSLVTAEDGNAAARVASKSLSKHLAYSDSGTDFTNTAKNVWVDDEAEGLDLINEVLGIMSQTAYGEFVNQGAYKALVKAPGEKGESQGGDTTSSTTTETLQEMVVNVTRADADSPMIAKIWLKETDMDVPMLIKGYIEVTEGVSATYPYGVMEAHFHGEPLSDGVVGGESFDMAMKIGAEDGQVTIEFVDTGSFGNNYSWTNKANILGNSDMSEGKAFIEVVVNEPEFNMDTDFFFAFDANHFKYQDGDANQFVLDKNTFSHQVYRYMVFNKADGSKVTRNSGIPFRLPDTEEYGYVGYYGLWAPYGFEDQLGNGATITDLDGTDYQIVRKKGKLTKHTAATLTLSDLDGVELSFWDDQSGKDLVIAWDNGAGSFKKMGERNNSNGQITYFDGTEDFAFSNEWQGAWCESLRAYLNLGRLYFQNNNPVAEGPTAATELAYHKEATINPASLENDLSLWYYAWQPEGAGEWKQYTFDYTDLVLKLDGVEVVYNDQTPNLWLSPMLVSATAPYIEPWEMHNQQIFYTWQSGENEWNQFTTVKNPLTGEYLQFDAPLQLTYTHTAENVLDAGDDNGVGMKFNFDYDGYQLQIPWKFDASANNNQGEWIPGLTMKDGTVVLDASANEYVVKGVEVEKNMVEADPATAAGLTIDTAIDPPTLAYDADKVALVGNMPTGVELKVIKGEVQ